MKTLLVLVTTVEPELIVRIEQGHQVMFNGANYTTDEFNMGAALLYLKLEHYLSIR